MFQAFVMPFGNFHNVWRNRPVHNRLVRHGSSFENDVCTAEVMNGLLLGEVRPIYQRVARWNTH